MFNDWDSLEGMESMTVTEFRPRLTTAMKLAVDGSPVVVTKQNLPTCVLVSWDDFKSAQEATDGQRLARNG